MDESHTPPVLDDLSELERAVVDAARHGVWAEPRIAMVVEELAVTENPDLRVRAVVIRELLIGRRSELDPRGLRVKSVRVVGQLDLDYITAVTGLFLAQCALPDGITCRYTRLHTINLGGSLVSTLSAEGLHTDGPLFLRNIVVRSASEGGMVRLLGAHIGGQLNLDGSKVTNDTGPAFDAERVHIDGHLFLRDLTVRGAGKDGTLRLFEAHIGGQLNLDGSKVTNDTGPALFADGLHTNDNLFLRNATLQGTGENGTVRLLGAHIGGQLCIDESEVINDAGPALAADGLRIDESLFLQNTTLQGTGELGTVRLPGAQIDGPARLKGTRLSNDAGPLLQLTEVQLAGPLTLPASTVCPNSSTEVAKQGCKECNRQMQVQGLTFSSLQNVSWRQWLHLLVHHTPKYSPQPYQQLAAVERAAGHDNNARHILITQQEDLRRRTPEALGGRFGRARHWLWGWLGRYGYRAHRLVITLALVLGLAAGLGYTAGQITTRPGHHAAERVPSPTATTTTSGTPCSTAELIGLGIDRGLPLGTTGLRARCDLDTGTRWGQAFTYAIWALQALVWALATLAIAAYTGLVRKPT